MKLFFRGAIAWVANVLVCLLKNKDVRNFNLSEWKFLKPYFSQCAEDVIVRNIIDTNFPELNKSQGFYVEVGAYEPIKWSNTYDLYRRGWKGILVEPNPQKGDMLAKARPRDIVVKCAISSSDLCSEMNYLMYKSAATNRLSLDSNGRNCFGDLPLSSIKVKTEKLSSIFDQYLPNGSTVDVLSVDCEGLDLEVLKSNDWSKYAPKIVISESFDDPEAIEFMKSNGYQIVGMTRPSLIFVKQSSG